TLNGPNNGTNVAASRRTVGLWACATLLGIWFAGMVMLAARWIRSYAAFARALPQSLSPTHAWAAELRDVCMELGLHRSIPLHLTERFGPALCLANGGYRLLIPRTACVRFSTQQRRS